MHRQPEASIDVIGRYYEDQIKLIENLWKVLPYDYFLGVKEHSNAIGDRGLSFYKHIEKLRNVLLIDHTADSHELIKMSQAVFTVSGTVLGKPSFTFAPVFFNKLIGCNRLSIDKLREVKSFSELFVVPPTLDSLGIEEFSDWIVHKSFSGIISDPNSDPRCVENVNIDLVGKAFIEVVS